MLGDPAEELAQLTLLGRGERGEKLALRLGRDPFGAKQQRGALLGEHDELAAAVSGIARPADQAVGFELIENADEVAGVYAQGCGKLRLRGGPGIGESVQDGELLGPQAELVEGGSQGAVGDPRQPGEQQTAALVATALRAGGGRAGAASDGDLDDHRDKAYQCIWL